MGRLQFGIRTVLLAIHPIFTAVMFLTSSHNGQVINCIRLGLPYDLWLMRVTYFEFCFGYITRNFHCDGRLNEVSTNDSDYLSASLPALARTIPLAMMSSVSLACTHETQIWLIQPVCKFLFSAFVPDNLPYLRFLPPVGLVMAFPCQRLLFLESLEMGGSCFHFFLHKDGFGPLGSRHTVI